MLNMELQKEQEINRMVTILQQIELTDIELLTRDANTLLMRKKRADMEREAQKAGQFTAAHWKPNRKSGEKIVDIKEKVDGHGEKNIRP